MKLAYIGLGALVTVALIFTGLFVAKGPQPEIIVPAEKLWAIGPLNITNTLLTSWIVIAFLAIMTWFATRSMKLIPSGAQNFFEGVIEFLLGQVESIAGPKNARVFFAVVATIFLFLITSNWMGLLPVFNAIGKTEDVGHIAFHDLVSEHPHKVEFDDEGHAIEDVKYAGWKMDKSGGIVYTKPGAGAVDFEVHEGETRGEILDRYIVFLAAKFGDFRLDGEKLTDEELEAPTAAMISAAAAHLEATPDAPKLLFAEGDHAETPAEGEHGEGEVHAVESPTLHESVEGIDFSESQKMVLVIPFFRGVFSDVNNTLALGIVAFFAIEFWGFRALGPGYLKKFFNLNGVNSFVGILELLSEFIRIISFTFRLFGNIFAGEVLILMLTFLMPFVLVDIIYGLELFVGFIQAAVFALLTLVFASMAVESHSEHDDGHDEHGGDGHHPQGTAQAHH